MQLDEMRPDEMRRDEMRQDKRRCDASGARGRRVEENEISAYLVHCLYNHPLFHIEYIHKPNTEKEYKRFRGG